MKNFHSTSLAALLAASGLAAAGETAAPAPVPAWQEQINTQATANDVTALVEILREAAASAPADAPAILAAAASSRGESAADDALLLTGAVVDGVSAAKVEAAAITAAHDAVFAKALELFPASAEGLRDLAATTASRIEFRLAASRLLGEGEAARFSATTPNPANAGPGAGITGSGDPRLIKGPKKVVSHFIP